MKLGYIYTYLLTDLTGCLLVYRVGDKLRTIAFDAVYGLKDVHLMFTVETVPRRVETVPRVTVETVPRGADDTVDATSTHTVSVSRRQIHFNNVRIFTAVSSADKSAVRMLMNVNI